MSTRPPEGPSQGPSSASDTASTPSAGSPTKSTGDVVVLGPPTADGAGVHVLRARNERIEAGELRALAEGKPLVGEVVTLEPRKDDPRVCDVKESWRPPPGAIAKSASSPASKKGPAQVANEAYRENWDEIFGKSSRGSGGAPN